MIYEIASIAIKPGAGPQFEAAVRLAAPHFQQAEGCLSFRLDQGIEDPDTYQLVVGWNKVEDHTVTFRQSDGFARWRELAGPFFARPPIVHHMHTVIDEINF